jgi:hypothetical protein
MGFKPTLVSSKVKSYDWLLERGSGITKQVSFTNVTAINTDSKKYLNSGTIMIVKTGTSTLVPLAAISAGSTITGQETGILLDYTTENDVATIIYNASVLTSILDTINSELLTAWTGGGTLTGISTTSSLSPYINNVSYSKGNNIKFI